MQLAQNERGEANGNEGEEDTHHEHQVLGTVPVDVGERVSDPADEGTEHLGNMSPGVGVSGAFPIGHRSSSVIHVLFSLNR